MSFSGSGGSKESIPVIMQGGSSSTPKKSGGGKWVAILVLVVVVIAAAVIINQQMNGTKKTTQGGEQVTSTTSQPSTTASSTPTSTPTSTSSATPATTTANSSTQVEIASLPISEVNGKTLIGLRAVLEADGWFVDWSNTTGEATCEKDGQQSVKLKPGAKTAQVGSSSKALDVVPIMRNDHVLVSPSWLKELTQNRLSYDASTKKAVINK